MSLKINQEQKGVAALLFLTLLYGLYGVFSRYIGIEFGTFSQNAIKSIIVSLIAAFIVYKLKSWISISKKDWPTIILWGSLSFISIVTNFVSYTHSSIAASLLVFYVGSISCVYVSGYFLFKEKLSYIKYLSLFLGFIGLIVITNGDISFSDPFYLLMSFISGITSGLWYSLSKILSKKYPQSQLLYIDSMSNLLLSFLAIFILGETIPNISLSISWIMIVLFAITQVCATSLAIYGYKHLEAQKAALITPMDIVFSTIFAFFVFNEGVELHTLLGGVLVIIALVLPNLFWKKNASHNPNIYSK